MTSFLTLAPGTPGSGYPEVRAERVAWRNRRAADAALAFAIADLGLPPLRIRWFDWRPGPIAPVPTATIAVGYCPPGQAPAEIWLRSGEPILVTSTAGIARIDALAPSRIALATIHEARHALDNVRWGGMPAERRDESERNAEAYAAQHRGIAEQLAALNRAERRKAAHR